MNYRNTTLAVSMAGMLGMFQPAHAHVSFGPNNAYAGKGYTATINVPHGCSDAVVTTTHYDTIKVVVTIPIAMTKVRPMDSVFGPATFEKDSNGNVTKLIWTKTTAALADDTHLYQFTFKGTLPDTPLKTLEFVTTQTCAGSSSKTWEGADVPKLYILPLRAPGWNKYTAQADIDLATITAFFSEAQIVWAGGAAYSANPVTAGLITAPLTTIPMGTEFWVKY